MGELSMIEVKEAIASSVESAAGVSPSAVTLVALVRFEHGAQG